MNRPRGGPFLRRKGDGYNETRGRLDHPREIRPRRAPPRPLRNLPMRCPRPRRAFVHARFVAPRDPRGRRGRARPSEHPLARRRGLRAGARLLRHVAGLDAEPRPACGFRRALYPSVYDRPGLLGEPVGLHDRHVPDHHRRPQPPLAPRRRLSPAARRADGPRLVPRGRLLHGQRPDLPRVDQRRRHGQDRLELHHRRPLVRLRPLGGPPRAHQPFLAQVNFQETHRAFTSPRTPTRRWSRSRRTTPTTPSPGRTGPSTSTPPASSTARSA